MNFNPLIGYWHSVDLQQVKDGLNSIPCDKVQVSYYDYPYPHRLVEKYFREHKEYTHLILVPNDLVYDVTNFEKTKKAILENDYPVLCGLCNVDLKQYKDFWNVVLKLPELSYIERRYRWLAESTRQALLLHGSHFILVGFAGFPATCVRRDVFDSVKINIFNDDIKTKEAPIWETKGGYSNDLIFCHNLHDVGIPTICDLENTMLHFRYTGEKQNGKKPAKVTFIPNGDNMV